MGYLKGMKEVIRMNEITETMLDELETSVSSYESTTEEQGSSFGCACGHTCQFRCEGGCWDESAMGF